MLVTLSDILPDAKKYKYGVGLFNTLSFEMARGVIAAAEETQSPVIIGTAEVLLPFAPLEELASLIVPMAKKASVPVVVHFDHGLTPELCIKAMASGFSSIMYDCSTFDYDENIVRCREMRKIAHTFGCSIEAELGHVGANEGGSAEGEAADSIYTDPYQAKEYAELTGVDALAVAIGTAHGAYKSKPKLDFERLEAIATLVKTPLVLHGGSGLSDSDFKTSIQKGISKVNIFTDIDVATATAAGAAQGTNQGMTSFIPDMVTAIKEATMKKMELFGSYGRGR